jgi:two-component system, OmpR family, KDP operon response regulator KdpE
VTATGKPRILVIEDEAPIRRFLRIALEGAGYDVDEAERGRQGLEKAATGAPGVVIVDLGLPDLDGKAVVQQIREWSQVPILILSVRDAESEKIAAFDVGANDYVTKPFSTGELLARLRALLRARAPGNIEQAQLKFAGLAIDLAKHVVTVDGAVIKLTRKEFEVLAFISKYAGRLVTHRQLLSTIWGPAHVEDSHYLRIAIGHIREKIGDDAANPTYIITEPGIGYRMMVGES